MDEKRNISNPAVVVFSGSDSRQVVEQDGRLVVTHNANWNQFKTAFDQFIEGHDGVIVSMNTDVDRDNGDMLNSINIKSKHINKAAQQAGIPAMSKHNDKWYLLNPSWDDKFKDYQKAYAEPNDNVLAKYESFADKDAWQEHQASVLDRMGSTFPIANASYKGQPDHAGDLTQPKRGLDKDDLGDYWSWKANETLNPDLYGDDFVGIPGIEAYSRTDFTMTPSKGPNAGVTQDIDVMVLQTANPNGLMIPMANRNGHVAKYQIATDNSAYNIRLKPRVADGTSIQHSEIYDKKKREYTLQMDGKDSGLKVTDVKLGKGKDVVTFKDAKGIFDVELGDQIKDRLIERGYDIPDIIDSLQVSQNAKYMWQGPGKMTGSKQTQNIVTPSDAGFIVAREPSKGKDDYLMIVTEGALKGKIVAKYLNEPDANGETVGDYLGAHSGRGLIVAQVPGVSKAFIDSVPAIYEKYNVSGTYIAMDADGRENLSVARGIHQSNDILKEHSPVKIMSWDPKHKGLDDALIAVCRGEITREDMDIHFGSPEKLFPLDKAKSPNPYKLDGTRANQQQWMKEYGESVKKSDATITQAQKDAEARAKEIEEAGKGLGEDIKSLGEASKNKSQSM